MNITFFLTHGINVKIENTKWTVNQVTELLKSKFIHIENKEIIIQTNQICYIKYEATNAN
jgi:hypothetical protein